MTVPNVEGPVSLSLVIPMFEVYVAYIPVIEIPNEPRHAAPTTHMCWTTLSFC